MTTTYRVYHLDSRLLSAIKTTRSKEGTTWETFLTQVVETHLDTITQQLNQLGFRAWARDKSTRLPIHPATLDMLREANEQTGIPATQLLYACCFQTTGLPEPRKSQRKASGARRPKTRQASQKAKGRQRKVTRGPYDPRTELRLHALEPGRQEVRSRHALSLPTRARRPRRRGIAGSNRNLLSWKGW